MINEGVYYFLSRPRRFGKSLLAIFASIPYDIQAKRDEAYYHTLFYLMVSASGADAESSMLTSKGRIDLAVSVAENMYIIEFKCNQSAKIAIQQIRGTTAMRRSIKAAAKLCF